LGIVVNSWLASDNFLANTGPAASQKVSVKQNISERLRVLRARRAWTQQELADALDHSRNYISMVEQGREPSAKFIRALALLESSPIDETTLKSQPIAHLSETGTGYHAENGPRSILKRARESKGWSPEELAKVSRVPAGFIRQVESGELRGSNERELRKLAKALHLDPDELLRGSDQPQIVGERATFGAKPDIHLTAGMRAKTIPLISMAQAGELKSYEDVYDYEGVIEYAGGKDPRAFAVQIRGDSMEPDYKSGTVAILYPSRKARTENLVVAKLKDGSVLFKRLQASGEQFTFVSINPQYPPLSFTERDIEWMYPVARTQKDEL
jgi:transcriptional regulator with XRE-family HTH domain